MEELLRDHPLINDAAVVGVPDTNSGEVPRAYIVPKDNEHVRTEEIEEYVNERVANYKRLKGGIMFVDSIPKNASGKILRRQLKAMAVNVL